jgi:hypothetical protein
MISPPSHNQPETICVETVDLESELLDLRYNFSSAVKIERLINMPIHEACRVEVFTLVVS